MQVPAGRKMDSITTKLLGERVTIAIEWLNVEADWMSFLVKTKEEALLASYAYRYSAGSSIEKATDSGYVVVIYKTKAA